MTEPTAIPLAIQPITPDLLAPYGKLVTPTEDGVPYGAADAVLELDRGIPRFYIMHLHHRPLSVMQITRHVSVTQCLATTSGRPWIIVVASPENMDDPAALPDVERMRAFLVPGGNILALHRGTWHAGPYFHGETEDFFNLELADTNITDHQTVRLDTTFGRIFTLGMPGASHT